MQSEKKRVVSVAVGETGDGTETPTNRRPELDETSCQTISHIFIEDVKTWLITTGLLAQALITSISTQQH